MTMEAYKFAPPNVPVVPQILSDIGMIHELKNESQWVLRGGVHSNEWDDVPVLEAITCQCFIVEPLPIGL